MSKTSKFGKFYKEFKDNKLQEETTSGDIATVDSKLDMVKRPKNLNKGKRCKAHGRLNCKECEMDIKESKWN